MLVLWDSPLNYRKVYLKRNQPLLSVIWKQIPDCLAQIWFSSHFYVDEDEDALETGM